MVRGGRREAEEQDGQQRGTADRVQHECYCVSVLTHNLHRQPLKPALPRSCQARVEKKLNKLLAEIRCGDRDGSVISSESIESIDNDERGLGPALP